MATPARETQNSTPDVWLYAEAMKEEGLVRYFLKALVDDPSGRNGNLRLAVNHARTMLRHIEQLALEEQST